MTDHLRMKGRKIRISFDLFWSVEDECYIATVAGFPDPAGLLGISGLGKEPKYALYELSIALTGALEVLNDRPFADEGEGRADD